MVHGESKPVIVLRAGPVFFPLGGISSGHFSLEMLQANRPARKLADAPQRTLLRDVARGTGRRGTCACLCLLRAGASFTKRKHEAVRTSQDAGCRVEFRGLGAKGSLVRILRDRAPVRRETFCVNGGASGRKKPNYFAPFNPF